MGSVDASVHASVEERPRKVEPSQGAAKRPSAFSSWSSQPAKQFGTTAGWSAAATAPNPAGPGMARKSPFSSFQAGTQTHGAVPPPQAMAPRLTAPLDLLASCASQQRLELPRPVNRFAVVRCFRSLGRPFGRVPFYLKSQEFRSPSKEKEVRADRQFFQRPTPSRVKV